jgi:hypothetical protein
MPYTHTFEITTDKINIQGQINFNHGENVTIKYDSAIEIGLEQQGNLQKLFEQVANSCKECGDLAKLEIVKL